MENGGRGGGGGGKGKGGPRKRTRSRGGRGRGGGGKGGDANAPPPAPGMDGSGRPPKVQAVAPPGAGPLPVPHKGARTSSTTRAHMTAARFDGYRGVVSDGTLKAIAEVLGYETMTKVQEQALPVCTRGRDVVAKAKTGTGKTLAFMIPCVDRAAASKAKRGGSKISALVLSPTRELAQQTLEEGRLLSHFHGLTLACVAVWIPTTGLGGPHQTSELSISVKSKSIRLIFGRIDCSRQVLEAQRKSLVQTVRLRAD